MHLESQDMQGDSLPVSDSSLWPAALQDAQRRLRDRLSLTRHPLLTLKYFGLAVLEYITETLQYLRRRRLMQAILVLFGIVASTCWVLDVPQHKVSAFQFCQLYKSNDAPSFETGCAVPLEDVILLFFKTSKCSCLCFGGPVEKMVVDQFILDDSKSDACFTMLKVAEKWLQWVLQVRTKCDLVVT